MVDTAVLLSTLVTKAQVASGAVEAVNPADVVAGGEGVEVRVVTQAIGDSTQNQFYTVASGDSLGSIAQKFYGDAVYFPAIFEANRTLLSSPDELQIGQRLVIPPASVL
jgi:nucleoid-associated protein YgaU